MRRPVFLRRRYRSPLMAERWDRRQRGETPEVFRAFAATIRDQQLMINRLKNEVLKLERERDA